MLAKPWVTPFAVALVASSSYLTKLVMTAQSSDKEIYSAWFYCTVLAVIYSFYRLVFAPNVEPSKDYHDNKTQQYAAMRSKHYFPAYANGWHAVCSSEDLRGGKVKSISALGTHMVAFRGNNGKVGVLHAFCPHLGAHLGQGGVVEGNLLVCPFHKWSFNSSGKCEKIPYLRKDIAAPPERAKTKSYPVKESLGQIFVWFHAEPDCGTKPQWDLTMSDDLEAGVKDGTWYYALMRKMEYGQHSWCVTRSGLLLPFTPPPFTPPPSEMAMNSADGYHFETLHGPFPIPFIDKVCLISNYGMPTIVTPQSTHSIQHHSLHTTAAAAAAVLIRGVCGHTMFSSSQGCTRSRRGME
jgi:nitrite reductase/ring-hydroxylating ferredoxin subunit